MTSCHSASTSACLHPCVAVVCLAEVDIVCDRYASNVVEKCLLHGSSQQRGEIIAQVLSSHTKPIGNLSLQIIPRVPFQVLGPEYTAALQMLRQTAATNTESESGTGAPTLLKEGEDMPEEVLSFAASSQMLGSLLAGTLPVTQLAARPPRETQNLVESLKK